MTDNKKTISSNPNIIDLQEKRKILVKRRFLKDENLAGSQPYETIRKFNLRGDVDKIKEIEKKISAYELTCKILFENEALSDKSEFDELFTLLNQIYELHIKAQGYYKDAEILRNDFVFESLEKKTSEPATFEPATFEPATSEEENVIKPVKKSVKKASEKAKTDKVDSIKPKTKKAYNKPRKFTFDE
ncbi:hypothetical protein G7017_03835 [Pseudomonas fulva]|uniref:Uncharacterized protein n=1 Tax=Pseudomonas paracarnis TaxID=2750625 RepID=A0ABU6BSU4_9PSED|nr:MULTISPECIES: hypothetical protein [Pseudomonas]MBA1220034.1 hypothetical protein [Pseudomonas fulva]MDG9889233.1 hypothetical protein [Pseudomonas juntendi]MEB3782400.1 hypothetical protein [Pseudomonas paracarnis]